MGGDTCLFRDQSSKLFEIINNVLSQRFFKEPKKEWRSRPRPVTVCIILQFTARLRECCLEAGVGGLHGRPHLGGEGEGEVGGVDHTVLAHQAQGNLA